jgi:DNA polymerase-3 subunit gamma/tau
MPSLYTVYRPKKFAELIGQSHITKLLKAELSKSLSGHAYLFIGPRGTGKTTTARILAKALNCESLDHAEPCGKCLSCVAFDEGKFLDLIEIDAASNRGIDEIRDIKEKIEYNPSMGKQKVYIIDEVHMLTKEAFNALLKTLEEPPNYVTFILATTEPQKVPATIMSRCEKFEFRLGGPKELSLTLRNIIDAEKIAIDKRGIDLLVTHAGGSFRDVISLLDTIVAATGDTELTEEEVRNALGLPDYEIVAKYIIAIAENSLSDAIATLEEVFARGTNIAQFTKSVILLLRDCMLDQKKANDIALSVAACSRGRYLECVKALLDAYSSQKNTFDQRLPLQLATLQLIKGEQEMRDLQPAKPIQAVMQKEPAAVVNPKIEIKLNEPEAVVAEVAPTISAVVAPIEKPKKRKKLKKRKAAVIEGKPIAFEDVERLWGNFTREVLKENKQLYTFVMPAVPSGILFDAELKVSKLELKVPFEFHRKQIESPKHQVTMTTAAIKVFGSPVQFVCIISKDQIVFKKITNETISEPIVSPALETVKVEAKPPETALESAFDSVLGADVETLG